MILFLRYYRDHETISLHINRYCGERKGEERCEGKTEYDSVEETNEPSLEKLLYGNCRMKEQKETNKYIHCRQAK